MDDSANNISAKLIQAVYEYRGGNRAAFRDIYSESEKYIFTCASKAFSGQVDAVDNIIRVMKETYNQIAVQINTLQNVSDFLNWAGMLAVKSCYYVMKEKNVQMFSEPAAQEEAGDVYITDSIAQDKSRQVQVKQMIASGLSDTQRLCVLAHYYNKQPVQSIAEAFGLSEQVVGAALQNTKRRLQDMVYATGYTETTQYMEAAPWLYYFFLEDVYACVVPDAVSAGLVSCLEQIAAPVAAPMTEPMAAPMTEPVAEPVQKEAPKKEKRGFFAGAGGIVVVVCICLAIVAGTGIFVWKYISKDKQDPKDEEALHTTADNADEQDGDNTHTASGLELVSIRSSFAGASTAGDYEIVTAPSVPEYTVNEDFSNVVNAEAYQYLLSDEETKQKLLQNGFVVTDGWSEEFFQKYEDNRYMFYANFVTTDSLLHTYHLYFAHLLKTTERDYFYKDLTEISNQMIAKSKAQYEELSGTSMEAAAKRNLAYFTVAAKLLDPDVSADPLVEDVVNQELGLISEAAGMQNSPVMAMDNPTEDPLIEDYTQYKPRGYYAESEQLSRYFQAMMWYGRISFRQANEEESRSAFLMSRAMRDSGILEKWREIYDVTSFFMGTSDDPGIYDYYPIIEAIYGDAALTDIAADEEKWEVFLNEISNLEPPSVNSIPVYANQTEEERAATICAFRFMGQRDTFDAAAFQKLIYSQVGGNSNGELRGLPSAMDIPAVFGSAEAEKILESQGAFDYKNYRENFDAIREGVAGAEDEIWTASLYNSWLNTLRPLCEEKGSGYPMFMQNTAWTRKQLNTFLSSFAELKHDSILYAKQVYAEMGGGDMPEWDDRGYVEPEPDLYARMAQLSAMTRDGLAAYGMISDADQDNLTKLQELSEQLLTISNKELTFTALTEEEYDLIRTYGGNLEHFWYEALQDEAVDGYLNPKQHPAAIIADIATDPATGNVLEVGTGAIDTIYVIVNVEGSLRIASGSVYSYYEFAQPMDQRLTDQEWRIMLGIDYETAADGSINYDAETGNVERPTWTNDFIVSY